MVLTTPRSKLNTIFKRRISRTLDYRRPIYNQDREYDTELPSKYNLVINPSVYDETSFKEKVKRLGFSGVPIIHHHGYVSELPPGHRFGMKKFHGVMKFLRRDGIVSMKQVVTPEPVDTKTVSLVHTETYIKKFFRGETSKDEQRRTGFEWTPGLLSRCRLEAGGTLLGAVTALQRGLACSTGGGTHHAFPDYGAGYCLLNDLSIAAKYVLQQGLAQKVLIVDLDVHQGDGTAAIFQHDSRVFTFSMHGVNNFPLRKQNSDLDVALPDKTKDADYLSILRHHLPCVLSVFAPDLILYDAGVDPHERDVLGRLSLTDQGLFDRDYYVIKEAVSQGIPCMTVIGGGYCNDINELSLRHTIVHRAAIKVWCDSGL